MTCLYYRYVQHPGFNSGIELIVLGRGQDRHRTGTGQAQQHWAVTQHTPAPPACPAQLCLLSAAAAAAAHRAPGEQPRQACSCSQAHQPRVQTKPETGLVMPSEGLYVWSYLLLILSLSAKSASGFSKGSTRSILSSWANCVLLHQTNRM